MVKQEAPSSELATLGGLVVPAHILNPAPLPPELSGLFDVRDWLYALLKKQPYTEPNPDFMQTRMALMTLQSETVEELLSDRDLDGLQKVIPDAPGMSTGPIMLTQLYVAKSDQAEGNPCYMLFSYVTKATGIETTTTTGVTQLQIQIASMLAMGIWPIEGIIKRADRKDRGGRYMLRFYPED
jgi:hypothetical protein